MAKSLVVGLVAHDACKASMVEWAKAHADWLGRHTLYGTGTTGGLINAAAAQLKVKRLKSGPLGGDQQLGAMIAEEKLDVLIFFIDPLGAHPHDVDVKALTRMATLANIPFALNPATADLVVKALS